MEKYAKKHVFFVLEFAVSHITRIVSVSGQDTQTIQHSNHLRLYSK